jgi:hypothetical protein
MNLSHLILSTLNPAQNLFVAVFAADFTVNAAVINGTVFTTTPVTILHFESDS